MRRILGLVLLASLGFSQVNCGPKAPSSPVVPGADSSYSFITNFGQDGTASYPSQFTDINAVAVSGDKVYVSDWDYWYIEVYDLNGNYLTYFIPWNSDNDYLADPYGLAADKYQHLYIADPYNDEIEVLNTAQIPLTVTGAAVTAQQYYGGDCDPNGVAVDNNGLIYVADYGCHEVYSFFPAGLNPGGGNGTDEGSVSINGGFLGGNGPYGIAAAPDGSKIYVADSSNNVVQVYDSSFNWLSVIGDATGGSSTVTGKFDFPAGLAVDNDGNLLVTDEDNARIQKFTPSGTFLAAFGDTASNVSAGQLYSPWQIAVDANNNVFVTDTNYETVFKYATNK